MVDAEGTVRRLYGAMNSGDGSLLDGVLYCGHLDQLGGEVVMIVVAGANG